MILFKVNIRSTRLSMSFRREASRSQISMRSDIDLSGNKLAAKYKVKVFKKNYLRKIVI